MPWWAIAYLVILLLIVIISIIKDIADHRHFTYVFAELASGIVSVSFIFACWYTELANILSWAVIPLLIYTISWDQYALRHMKKAVYRDLTETENKDMHQYSKLFAVLFMLPCYAAGACLSYQLLQHN
jgi:hypothetical protein